MKKRFKTVLDQSAADQAAILVSAGKIGCQVELAPGIWPAWWAPALPIL